MKTDKLIKKGKIAVISKNGKIIFAKDAKNKGLRIECNSDFVVEEKAKEKLTVEENKKLK